jgi:hypothetical protein
MGVRAPFVAMGARLAELTGKVQGMLLLLLDGGEEKVGVTSSRSSSGALP